jgi:hypothetical protein
MYAYAFIAQSCMYVGMGIYHVVRYAYVPTIVQLRRRNISFFH